MVKIFPNVYKKEIKKIIKISNILINNKIIFQNKWDMEQTQEYINYEGKINWLTSSNDDDEYIFMKNRHSFIYTVAQAYYLTNDEKYVLWIIKTFNSWIEQRYDLNGLESKVNRCLDKGIRMVNWVNIWNLIESSKFFDDKIQKNIKEIMKEHAVVMINEYPINHKLSNHGLMQNHGVIKLMGKFPNWKIWNIKNKKLIQKRLEENIKMQILPDGIHWEQSPMYHAWAVKTLLEIKIIYKKINFKMTNNTNSLIEKSVWGIIKFIKPNGHQPMQSDSDDTNILSILQMATIVFKNGYFKYLCSQKIEFQNLFSFQENETKLYKEISKKKINFTSIECKESGNYYLRSGYQKNASYLTFRNGQYGSGHAHSDPNHFTIFANGIDWISNTGRFTYKENKDRIKFKSGEYHNTQIINNMAATRIKNSWSFNNIATTIKTQPFLSNKIDYVFGINLGFIYDEKTLVPKREIFFVKPNYWLINDILYSKEKNNLKLNFHIDKKIDITNENNKLSLKNNNKEFNIFNLSKMNVSISAGEISKKYNLKESSNIISMQSLTNGDALFTNVFETQNNIKKIEKISIYDSNNKVVNDILSSAHKISFSDKDFDIICSINNEIARGKKIYRILDYYFYGKKLFLQYRNNILIFEKIIKY